MLRLFPRLIHAATHGDSGYLYGGALISPLFEFSPTTLSVILIIGGTTAFFTGLLAVTQYDIKRVIAYSTLSQLGYMAVALGASAYDAAIFHLFTHAFFKALLFLAAGSVIIALHHEQDMRKMGGLVFLFANYLSYFYDWLIIIMRHSSLFRFLFKRYHYLKLLNLVRFRVHNMLICVC